MKQGEEYLSQGMHEQAAENFLAAVQAENTSCFEEKFEKAIRKLYDTCASMNPTNSNEIVTQLNDWASSAPNEHLKRLLFISAENPVEKGVRENAIAILRKRYEKANWEEKLTLELQIIGLPIESLETSSLTVISRPNKPVEMKTLNIWLRYNYDVPGKKMTQDVIEVLKESWLPNVNAVMYGISTFEDGVRVVKICDVK